jgi:uroporphyrinogen III methyltransferase/synthase
VEHFFEALAGKSFTAKVAAIGPGTAKALEARSIAVALRAKDSRGEGMAEELLRAFASSRPRVLLARAEVARDVLPDAIRAACDLDVVAVYATRRPEPRVAADLARAFESGEIDAVLFTSGSTVDSLCDTLGDRARDLLARVRVASIGPVTTDAARHRGVHVDVVAGEPTVEALVDALEAAFSASV